jgi:hypothetical protein
MWDLIPYLLSPMISPTVLEYEVRTSRWIFTASSDLRHIQLLAQLHRLLDEMYTKLNVFNGQSRLLGY